MITTSQPCWLGLVLVQMVICCQSATDPSRLVLDGSAKGNIHERTVKAITICSQQYYTDRHLTQTAIITPYDKESRLLVQFVFLDLPPTAPCRDTLSLCELSSMHGHIHMCWRQMMDNYCGFLSSGNLEGMHHPPGLAATYYMETVHPGGSLRIHWATIAPTGHYRGFKLVITSFKSRAQCRQSPWWSCGDERCVHPDVRCDRIRNCLNGTDETVKCPGSNLGSGVEDCATLPCVVQRPLVASFQRDLLALLVPMTLAIVLLLLATSCRFRRRLQNILAALGLAPPPSPLPGQETGDIGEEYVCVYSPHTEEPLMVPLNLPSDTQLPPPPYSPPSDSYYSQLNLPPPSPSTQGELPPQYDEVNYTTPTLSCLDAYTPQAAQPMSSDQGPGSSVPISHSTTQSTV